jgi:hypothetical protein
VRKQLKNVLRLTAIPLLSLTGAAAAQQTTPGESYVEQVTLSVASDTSVVSITPYTNYGGARTLDANRALVAFSESELRSKLGNLDYVESAKLRFTLTPSLLPRLKRVLSAHRVTKAWTESGATWTCAVDSNTGNLRADCAGATAWNMNSTTDYNATPEGTATLPSLRFGTIEIDVTEDMRKHVYYEQTVPHHGWLLKTDLADLTLLSDLASRESSTPPQIVMSVRRCGQAVCDDGIRCTQDLCVTGGTCMHLTAPPVALCDDQNACTVNDHCSGEEDNLCIAGSPAAAGTECGSGLVCDGAGACVEALN